MLTRTEADTVNHSWLIVFNYQELTQVISSEKNVDGGWLEGWGREALDNVAGVGKRVGLIIHRILFLMGFEVRQYQLLLRRHLNQCQPRNNFSWQHDPGIQPLLMEKSHFLFEQSWCLQGSETLTNVYVFCPLQPVFPCQQPAGRGESQVWLRQNEHTCGMWCFHSDLVHSKGRRGCSATTDQQVADKSWLCSLREPVCRGGAGSSGRSLSTHSARSPPPACSRHAYVIRFTSTEWSQTRDQPGSPRGCKI